MHRPRRFCLLILVAAAAIAPIAYAQTSPEESRALLLARQEAAEALARSKRLDREARNATDEAARARAESAALAARVEVAEAEITSAETQVRMIERLHAQQRSRLAEREEPVARLVAALQTMSRRPPALALVQPGSLDNMIHVRALLSSTLPVVRARTAAVREEIAAGNKLRAEADKAVAALRSGREQLKARRLELSRFEVSQRRRSQSLAESALFQSDRALALSEEARDLQSQFGSRQYQAKLREELSGLPGPSLRPIRIGPARPAGPFGYRLPVEAPLLAGTGEISASGVHSRGMAFGTRGGEAVVAPAGGRIIYAAPFRSYGLVIMIDHGGGWTSVLTNLARIEGLPGSQIRAGDPIGRARPGSVSVELRKNGKPTAISPLLGLG